MIASSSDHCLYRKRKLHHCCGNLALRFIIVDVDFDFDKLGRCQVCMCYAWKSFGRGGRVWLEWLAFHKNKNLFWRV